MKKRTYRIVVQTPTKTIVHIEEDYTSLHEINSLLASDGCVVIGFGVYTLHSIVYLQLED